MSSEQRQQLNMGILLDIIDEEWMRETLPHDDVPLPSDVAPRTEDTEEASSYHFRLFLQDQQNQRVDGETWRDLALDNR